MDLVGTKVRMIISDPWEKFKDTKAIVESSFTHEVRQYILLREESSDEWYLITPRYLDGDLEVILKGQGAPVGIFEIGELSPALPTSEIVNNSHYMGIGAIELAIDR